MSSLAVMLGSAVIFILAQVHYSKFLYYKVFGIRDDEPTPAHTLKDGVDYVPSKAPILFGHHFASIAGLGPILGPAVAVIWGWGPALVWVIVGSVFFGAVHDFAALVLSVRHEGKSIGEVALPLLGVRGRFLLLLLIFFAVSLAMGVFAYVIPGLLLKFPQVVIPSVTLMVLAVSMGYLGYRKGFGLISLTVGAVILMVASIWYGKDHPVTALPLLGEMTSQGWIYVLLVYSLVASVLPVWLLLQPRDYLNCFQLYGGMVLLVIAIVLATPPIVAPIINKAPTDVPPWFPFLFITVACGAISGFHSIVSSGTTSKQLDKASDARSVAYGGMVTEGFLAVLAIIACTAGFASREGWLEAYSTYAGTDKLKLPTFVNGAAAILSNLGIPESLGATLISLTVVGFALTTLDTGTRLLRYNVEEIAKALGFKRDMNRYLSSSIAVIAIGNVALVRIEGQSVGLILWQLFGSTNQLLAGLGLLVATLYLLTRRRTIWYTFLPMLFMVVVTAVALVLNVRDFWKGGQVMLTVLGSCILVLTVWFIGEAWLAYRRTIAVLQRSK